MKAVVVYESHWGNTAEVARAIAIWVWVPIRRSSATDEATGSVLADADLMVAGAPVIAFRLETEAMRREDRGERGPGATRAEPDAAVDARLARPPP